MIAENGLKIQACEHREIRFKEYLLLPENDVFIFNT